MRMEYNELAYLRPVPFEIAENRRSDFRKIVDLAKMPNSSTRYNLNARLAMLDALGCSIPTNYLSLS